MTLDRAFAELRLAMFALAYRITGSPADAEDIVQDAFLRLHRTQPEQAVRSLKSYLATITARLSLNRLRARRARRETYVGEWLPEPLPTEDESAIRAEDISFALLVMLERLSVAERVVFVLRSAFDLPFEEIAPIVRRDVAACRKIHSRARARIAQQRSRFAVDRVRHRALMRDFAEAVREGDVGRLTRLLADDVVLHGDGGGRAVATKKPVVGAPAVARFVIAVTQTLPPGADVDEIELNGAPALAARLNGAPVLAVMLDISADRISAIFAIANPDKLAAMTRRGRDAAPA